MYMQKICKMSLKTFLRLNQIKEMFYLVTDLRPKCRNHEIVREIITVNLSQCVVVKQQQTVDLFEISVEAKESIAWFIGSYRGHKKCLD